MASENEKISKYPLIFLFHSHFDNFLFWAKNFDIQSLSDQLQVFFVCIDQQSQQFEQMDAKSIRVVEKIKQHHAAFVDFDAVYALAADTGAI